MMRLLASTLMVLVCASPVVAEGLTLKDFNTPSEPDPLFAYLSEAGVDVPGMLTLVVANDDCKLGLTDDELLSLIAVVEMWGQNSRAEGEALNPRYDLTMQSTAWSHEWDAASRVVRLRLCQPHKTLIEGRP